jgi:membrane associated rhomboid family serine protease
LSSYRRRSQLDDLGAQMGMTPAVTLLVALNLAVFAVQFLVDTVRYQGYGPLMYWLSFIPEFAFKGQVWRFVTYMFMHGGMLHILMNMFVLWMFGPRIEEVWGKRTFLIYYFACGIGAALTYGAFSLVGLQAEVPMVGASGAIFGLLLAFGVTYPDALIMIFFIIPMRAKYAVMIFGLIELASVPRADSQTAHLAHLGGMLFGYLFLLWSTGGRLGRIPRVPRFGGGGRARTAGYDRSPRGTGGLGGLWRNWRTRMRIKVVDGQRSSRGEAKPASGGNGALSREDRERVDRILEKISREGLQNLTAEEQEILRRASRKD